MLFYSIQLVDGVESTRDNVHGLLPSLFDEGGFDNVSVREELRTMLGTWRCTVPVRQTDVRSRTMGSERGVHLPVVHAVDPLLSVVRYAHRDGPGARAALAVVGGEADRVDPAVAQAATLLA